MKKNYKIGILGLGVVGEAANKYFEAKKIRVYKYDKYKKVGSVNEVNQADVIFVCVPTPYRQKTGFDLSFVRSAIGILSGPKILVIKSSVVPGTSSRLQKDFPKHKFLFNPEFLREASPYRDFIRPERQIVGYTSKSKAVVKDILNILPKSRHEEIMPCGEAEMVKYMANAFLALKVVYANEFFDLCEKLGLNYNKVKQAVAWDSRIGNSHFNIFDKGYRGYGGSCLPKDVNAIMQLATRQNLPMPLLKVMRSLNRQLLRRGALDENYFLTDKHKAKL